MEDTPGNLNGENTYNVEESECLVEVAALGRDVHGRRLGPRIGVRVCGAQVSGNLALLEMPDTNALGFYLERDDLVLVVESLVEGAFLSVEAAALRGRAVGGPVAVRRLLGHEVAFLDVYGTLLRRV